MKIVVTGAGGLLGTHCCRMLGQRHDVLGLDHSQLDICDRKAIADLFEQSRPDALINCATINVDDCERDPELAKAINVDGPAYLAEGCGRIGAQLVHFSTNYVFSGNERDGRAYGVDDPPQPLNHYGRTKAEGERVVREILPESHVIRTSWVYGPERGNFLGTIHVQLRAGRRINAIADSWASTTYAPDLVTRIEELLQQRCYGLHQIVSDGICSRYDFAKLAAKLIGISEEQAAALIEVVSEAGAGQQAPRPRWSPMRLCSTAGVQFEPLRPWQEALRVHVAAA